jgi:hypothetical protein
VLLSHVILYRLWFREVDKGWMVLQAKQKSNTVSIIRCGTTMDHE